MRNNVYKFVFKRNGFKKEINDLEIYEGEIFKAHFEGVNLFFIVEATTKKEVYIRELKTEKIPLNSIVVDDFIRRFPEEEKNIKSITSGYVERLKLDTKSGSVANKKYEECLFVNEFNLMKKVEPIENEKNEVILPLKIEPNSLVFKAASLIRCNKERKLTPQTIYATRFEPNKNDTLYDYFFEYYPETELIFKKQKIFYC